MRSILWGVHLLGHAVKEVPTFVKSMPQPSDVMKRTVLMLHARNTLLERYFLDRLSGLGCTPRRGCQIPGSGLMQAFN